MLVTKLLTALLLAAAPLQPEPPTKTAPPAKETKAARPADGKTALRNLTYAEAGGQKLLLDLFLPGAAPIPASLKGLEGRSIREVHVTGLQTLDRKIVDDQIRSTPGGKLSLEELRQDVQRLNRLGRFARIDVSAQELDDSSIGLTYQCTEGAIDPPRPVVIWIHGGAWEGGDKENCPGLFLVPHGYAVVSVSYRLTGVAPFPAQIHDCKAAVRWLRAHAKEHNLDPDRIGVWGASAGGHLAALLGASGGVKDLEGDVGDCDSESSRVQAVCDWFGPTDLVKLCRGASNAAGRPTATTPIFKKFLGGELDDKLDLCKSANPITYVDSSDPPTLIMHGDKDQLVPLSQSEELVDALKKASVPVELEVIKDAGHGFWNQEIVDKITKFFDQHLKKNN